MPLQQLCLATSLYTAFTTRRVYSRANYTLLLSRNSSSTTATAQSPRCMQQWRLSISSHFFREHCTIPCEPAAQPSIAGSQTPHK